MRRRLTPTSSSVGKGRPPVYYSGSAPRVRDDAGEVKRQRCGVMADDEDASWRALSARLAELQSGNSIHERLQGLRAPGPAPVRPEERDRRLRALGVLSAEAVNAAPIATSAHDCNNNNNNSSSSGNVDDLLRSVADDLALSSGHANDVRARMTSPVIPEDNQVERLMASLAMDPATASPDLAPDSDDISTTDDDEDDDNSAVAQIISQVNDDVRLNNER